MFKMLQFVRMSCGSYRVVKTICSQSVRSISNYNHETQRKFLSELPGGSVDLSKDEESGIATVVLNYIDRKNALSGKMMVDLSDVVTELERWKSGRGLLLHGAANTFCSGGDLTLMKSIFEAPKGAYMSKYMQDTLTRLFRLPLVTLAHIEGKALGGGAEVAIACDFRSMANDATVGFVQARLGITAGFGGVIRLVQLLGRRRALFLLSSSCLLTSEQAREFGLVDFVTDTGASGLSEAREHLEMLTAGYPEVIQATKKAVVNATDVDYNKILETECQLFQSVFGGPAHIEAMSGNVKFAKGKK